MRIWVAIALGDGENAPGGVRSRIAPCPSGYDSLFRDCLRRFKRGWALGRRKGCEVRAKGRQMPTEAEIQEENRKVRRLQLVVDLVTNLLWQSDIPIEEASELVAQTRQFALNLFPDKGQTYDMIYQSRFRRLLAEKYRLV
jgi:hypothetical protein